MTAYFGQDRKLAFNPTQGTLPQNALCEWSVNDVRDNNNKSITRRYTLHRLMAKATGGEVIRQDLEEQSELLHFLI